MPHAAVPREINYQGILADSDGNSVPDGDYEMSFAIYDVSTGGDSLWDEDQTVTVTNGIYNVILGHSPFPTDLFNRDLYLGVTVGTDAEMIPRQKLTSTPFAMKAAGVADGGVTSVMIKDGAVTTEKVADNAVTTAKIVDGTVTTDDINDGSGSGLDADKLDGLEASHFMPALADNWVNEAGDTMTGPLHIENGTWDLFNTEGAFKIGNSNYRLKMGCAVAGTGAGGASILAQGGINLLNLGTGDRYVLTIRNDSVGIGMTDPTEKLTVNGRIESTSGGIKFPDGTVQTTAAAPTWHQKLPAAERFELVMDNQAVLDKETGLVWARNANIGGNKTWQSAINYCADLSISDRKGWRIPEREELASLLDMSVSGFPKLPAGYSSFFTDVQPCNYWSSTTYEDDSTYAWSVLLEYGSLTHNSIKDLYLAVWPVRSDN